MNAKAKRHTASAKANYAKGRENFYRAASDIDAALKADPMATQKEIAADMGIGKNKVGALLAAYRAAVSVESFEINWNSGPNRKEDVIQRAKPEDLVQAVQKAIELAPPEQRQKLVDAVTDTSTVAGRHIDNKVRERELAEKRAREGSSEPLTGIPLPALWASISVTINKWTLELSRFRDEDLEELAARNPEGADAVARTVEGHAEQTQRWLRGLRPGLRAVEDGGVIEGVIAKVGEWRE